MNSWSWQRVVSIALILGTACVAMLMKQDTLAATLVGMAGGLALPQVQALTSSPILRTITGGDSKSTGGDDKKAEG